MQPESDTARRVLPNGKLISPLGFGCSSLWSKPSFPAEAAKAMLEAAVANGINYFDTAPSYAEGEVRLGIFLRDRDTTELVISTKVGTEAGDHFRSFDPERMRRSFDASLDRLGVDRVDILYLHGPSIADLNTDVFAFFDSLKAEGRIDYCGVNSFAPRVVARCLDVPVDVVMLQYSVSDRRFDRLIDQLADKDRVVIAGTILAQGIFDLNTFIPRDRASMWYLFRALKNDPLFLRRGVGIARRTKRTGLDPHEAAVRFAISNSRLTSCLFGTRNQAHLVANARLANRPLSPELVRTLRGG
ncbi:oxidoreductase [Mycolicibacterium cyprinidarum]|uniref:Oxidoreductase n=1 Tax=Mycolicibacterium cyprinidarum TaxID=2860311 RepID=A0ABQ4VFD8_9MYCO|nr:oxidoreductase [Mycolicibacterium sp. NGTWS0302]GJF17845.1 oxidoreductase [Mycolicibacterium sp. NGTWSNA01]